MWVCCNRARVCGSRVPSRVTLSTTGRSASRRSSARNTRAKEPRPSSSTSRKPAMVWPDSGKVHPASGSGGCGAVLGHSATKPWISRISRKPVGDVGEAGLDTRPDRGPRRPPRGGNTPRRSGPRGPRHRATDSGLDTIRRGPTRRPRGAGPGRLGGGPGGRRGAFRAGRGGTRSGRGGCRRRCARRTRTVGPGGRPPERRPRPRFDRGSIELIGSVLRRSPSPRPAA